MPICTIHVESVSCCLSVTKFVFKDKIYLKGGSLHFCIKDEVDERTAMYVSITAYQEIGGKGVIWRFLNPDRTHTHTRDPGQAEQWVNLMVAHELMDLEKGLAEVTKIRLLVNRGELQNPRFYKAHWQFYRSVEENKPLAELVDAMGDSHFVVSGATGDEVLARTYETGRRILPRQYNKLRRQLIKVCESGFLPWLEDRKEESFKLSFGYRASTIRTSGIASDALIFEPKWKVKEQHKNFPDGARELPPLAKVLEVEAEQPHGDEGDDDEEEEAPQIEPDLVIGDKKIEGYRIFGKVEVAEEEEKDPDEAEPVIDKKPVPKPH